MRRDFLDFFKRFKIIFSSPFLKGEKVLFVTTKVTSNQILVDCIEHSIQTEHKLGQFYTLTLKGI